jgi:uncharacterized membrane protein YoaK (UPF0700 family)
VRHEPNKPIPANADAEVGVRGAVTLAYRRALPAGLSFVAGYVDTAGFVALFGLFTAHVTGNFVLIGSALVHPGPGIVAKLLALPVFAVVVGLARLLSVRLRGQQRAVVRMLLGLQAFFLFAFLVAGVSLGPFADADLPGAVLTGMLGVAAMAFQNAAMRDSLGHIHPTTLMTGNVTQVVLDVVDLWTGTSEGDARATMRRRMRRLLWGLVAFTLGCAMGAGLTLLVGFWCLAVPLAATVVMAVAPEAATRSAG